MDTPPTPAEPEATVPTAVTDQIQELLKKPTLTVEEAGIVLGVSRPTAYRAVRAGQIPVIEVSRSMLVPTAKLRQMLGIAEAA